MPTQPDREILYYSTKYGSPWTEVRIDADLTDASKSAIKNGYLWIKNSKTVKTVKDGKFKRIRPGNYDGFWEIRDIAGGKNDKKWVFIQITKDGENVYVVGYDQSSSSGGLHYIDNASGGTATFIDKQEMESRNKMWIHLEKAKEKKWHADQNIAKAREARAEVDNAAKGSMPRRLFKKADDWIAFCEEKYSDVVTKMTLLQNTFNESYKTHTNSKLQDYWQTIQTDYNYIEDRERELRRKRERLEGERGFFGKIANAFKKVALAPMRAIVAIMIKNNMRGMATMNYKTKTKHPDKYDKVKFRWEQLGGNPSTYDGWVETGRKKRASVSSGHSNFNASGYMDIDPLRIRNIRMIYANNKLYADNIDDMDSVANAEIEGSNFGVGDAMNLGKEIIEGVSKGDNKGIKAKITAIVSAACAGVAAIPGTQAALPYLAAAPPVVTGLLSVIPMDVVDETIREVNAIEDEEGVPPKDKTQSWIDRMKAKNIIKYTAFALGGLALIIGSFWAYKKFKK